MEAFYLKIIRNSMVMTMAQVHLSFVIWQLATIPVKEYIIILGYRHIGLSVPRPVLTSPKPDPGTTVLVVVDYS